jgi:hypothetical protein
MPRHPSTKAKAALEYINKKAAKLRQKYPGMSQKEAISKASEMYRKKKKQY